MVSSAYKRVLREEREAFIAQRIREIVEKPDHAKCKFVGLFGNKHVHAL